MRECLPIHSDMGSYPVSRYELFYSADTRPDGTCLIGYKGKLKKKINFAIKIFFYLNAILTLKKSF